MTYASRLEMDSRVEILKNRNGFFEMHPSEPAIIVKYRVDAIVVGPGGQELSRAKRNATKLIHIANLAGATDLRRVAREVLARCSYINPAQADEVEQILTAIRNRRKLNTAARPSSAMRPMTSGSALQKPKVEAKISELPRYRQLLYGTVEDRLQGCEMVLQLVQSKLHAQQIVQTEAVINALARLLLEDAGQNIDLLINLCRIFGSLVDLPSTAELFAKHRIGATLMQGMSTELQRYTQLRIRINQPEQEPAMVEPLRKQFAQIARKQDEFLLSAIKVLTTLGLRDSDILGKMVKKDVISILIQCCERPNPEVQLPALRFLHRLSLYAANMPKFGEAGVVQKLARVLDHQHSKDLNAEGLKLLINLSLCPALRKTMLKKGFSRRMVTLFDDEEVSDLAARLLYAVSQDNRFSNDLFFGELCVICGQKMMDFVEKDLASAKPYLLSLIMNLVSTEVGAEAFGGAVDLVGIVENALKTSDVELLKVVNIVVRNSSTPITWLTDNNLLKIVKVISGKGIDAFILECVVGLAALLDRNLLTVETLSKHYKIDLELIERCQHQGSPDAMLVLVVFMGAIASQKQGAKILHDVSMTNWLCEEISNINPDDEDLLLQITYAMLKLTQYEPARQSIVNYPGLTEALSNHVQRASDLASSLLEEFLFHLSTASTNVHEAWMMEKFQQFNAEWLKAIGNRKDHDHDDEYDYLDEYDDGKEADEMDLVTKYGLDVDVDELSGDELDVDADADDVEDMIERYSARTYSQMGFRKPSK